MENLFRYIWILLSTYLLISIAYMTWATIYRPRHINELKRNYLYSSNLYGIKSLLVKSLLVGAFIGFILVVGIGVYQMLYWVPNLSGPDIDGDWNSSRRLISYLIGSGVGGAVYLQLSEHAKNKVEKSIMDNLDKP